ncbi:5-formyltetrahydrofolate cyclo-ligase [uncultured Christiangramia sp.]|uniref:5-formyltetrahydrofolate cyclo-ligase n=1 Tax=Christiangramia sp. 3-2217-3z TaxID=3417564 RepID=UPI00263A22F5|nr:5-formyltetrahydrofolate cyclo-ligase [uncultured Christiangramia sp.]
MKKSEIRKKFKLLRSQLAQADIESMSIDIANRCLELRIWDARYFHIFLSIAEQKEVNTEYLLHVLQGKDKEIIVPKSDFETGEMINYLLTDQTRIVKNPWNIPEPVDGIQIAAQQLDAVFIPVLALDKSGHRVGYGKGFYDRFLSRCKKDIIKIGVSFYGPVDEISDVYTSDIPLDYCVTPNRIYDFRKK